MKKTVLIVLSIIFTLSLFAKKVKFAVDMTGQTISPNGVHISGDFQTLAGYSGGDWNAATCEMIKEGLSEIYSIIVDIPAFQKYEYRFINGDLFYETEFVPVESRVGYDFVDNRWIYVDSLANDTTFYGAVLFGGNAPQGMKLLRLYVDMSQQTISAHGAYVASSFNNWNYTTTPLYSFENNIYEAIQYVAPGTHEYKFANGNSPTDAEIVPTNCSLGNNRFITIENDTLTEAVCFGACTPCGTGINYHGFEQVNIFPNPTSGNVYIVLNEKYSTITIYDLKGSIIFTQENPEKQTITLNKLSVGTYVVKISDFKNNIILKKYIVN